MVATKTSLNFRSALRAFSASAMFLAFLVAPAAHALGNDDFGNLGANTPTLIDDINIASAGTTQS